MRISIEDFLRQYIEDYLSCVYPDIEIDDDKMNSILIWLLNSDHLWNEVDFYVNEALEKFEVIKEEK